MFTVPSARDAGPASPPVPTMPVNYEILELVRFLEWWIRLLNKLQVEVKAKVEGKQKEKVKGKGFTLCAMPSALCVLM